MAENISEAGIATGQLVLASQILQLTDAMRGDEAYNLHMTGGIQINDNFYPTGSGSLGDGLVLSEASRLTFGLPNANTASYISSSNVDGPFGMDSVATASFALTASYLTGVVETFRQDFTAQTLVTVNHNFGTENVVVQTYDTTGANPVQIDPSTVTTTITSDNQITTGFGAPTTGYVVVSKGGFTVAGTIQDAISASYALTASHVTGLSKQRYEAVLNNSSANYVLTHGLGQRLVVVAAYNPAFEQVIPTSVETLDANTVDIRFTTLFTGSVVVLA